MTLTEFLLARISEDESGLEDFEVYCGESGGAHYSTERVRAECDVKRQLAELHQPYGCTDAGQPGHEHCSEREWCYTCSEGLDWPCLTLRLLTLPYASHPDYREEWRP